MKRLLDIDKEMRSHEETLNNLHQAVMREEVVVRHHARVLLHRSTTTLPGKRT